MVTTVRGVGGPCKGRAGGDAVAAPDRKECAPSFLCSI